MQALLQNEGRVLSTWDADRLVAFGSLDTGAVGGDPGVMKLDMLYVDSAYRGRGIGRTLTGLAVDIAKARGAQALYISATPTRGTVDAYLRMGARLLAVPDSELFELEPEDIHLLLELT